MRDLVDEELAALYAKEVDLFAKELRLAGCVVLTDTMTVAKGERFLWVGTPPGEKVPLGRRAIVSLCAHLGQIYCRSLSFRESAKVRDRAETVTATLVDLDDALDWVSERIREAERL